MKEAIAIAFNKLGTKTFGLFAKDQRITGLDRDIPHRLGCACREKKATLNWDDMIDKFVDVIVDLYILASSQSAGFDFDQYVDVVFSAFASYSMESHQYNFVANVTFLDVDYLQDLQNLLNHSSMQINVEDEEVDQDCVVHTSRYC